MSEGVVHVSIKCWKCSLTSLDSDALKRLLSVFADGCLDVVAACVSVPVIANEGVCLGVSVDVSACVLDAGVVSAASTVG